MPRLNSYTILFLFILGWESRTRNLDRLTPGALATAYSGMIITVQSGESLPDCGKAWVTIDESKAELETEQWLSQQLVTPTNLQCHPTLNPGSNAAPYSTEAIPDMPIQHDHRVSRISLPSYHLLKIRKQEPQRL